MWDGPALAHADERTRDDSADEGRCLSGPTSRASSILGNGPVVIGQAAEFDDSGTQAVRALREEGYRVILVGSNPATIRVRGRVSRQNQSSTGSTSGWSTRESGAGFFVRVGEHRRHPQFSFFEVELGAGSDRERESLVRA